MLTGRGHSQSDPTVKVVRVDLVVHEHGLLIIFALICMYF